MESLIGKIIDGYRILEVVGRGGMGVVYKALDTSLDKVMALKMIDPILAKDENFLKRFKTEARALARLENPNIVTVHALRETEFGVFMVMEYVEAKTISDWIRENGAFSWEDTIQISKQLLNAVGHAHKVGVIHRDIKPSNILLSKDFRVKVTDFGLAKVIRQHGPSSTVTQMRAGTLYYMSPEQVKGLKNVDFRSDIYSLGMTLYEMLVGRTPFEKTESDFSIQKQIVEGQIPSLTKFKANIPKPLVKIVTKSIDKDPLKRFQSAEEMLELVEDFDFSAHEDDSSEAGPPKSISLKAIFLATAFLLVIFLGYIMISDPFHFFEANNNSKPVTKMASLTLSTVPSGASVFLNDSSLGLTPLEKLAVKDGRVTVQIQKDGYHSIDTSLLVQSSRTNIHNFILKEVSSAGVEPVMGTLVITSQPGEASVWINNRFIGTTPRENEELKAGRYTLLLRKRGYAEYRQNFSVQTRQTTRIAAIMEALGNLSVGSQPAGADIMLNGVSIGTTPLNNKELKTGNYQLILRKYGYEDFSTTVSINASQPANVSGTLVAKKGDVKILIRPWGSIYIDGVLKGKDINNQFETTLPVGLHQIKAVHPSLGEWEKQVRIENNATQDIVIDFNRVVTLKIISDPNYCEIFLDGKATGDYTPKQIKLKTGKHTISVRKSGYTLPGGDLVISVNEDVKEPLHFELKKTF